MAGTESFSCLGCGSSDYTPVEVLPGFGLYLLQCDHCPRKYTFNDRMLKAAELPAGLGVGKVVKDAEPVLRVGDQEYWLTGEVALGDFCAVVMAEFSQGEKPPEPVCLKVPYVLGDCDLVRHEAEVLCRVSGLHPGLPNLVRSFALDDGRYVNVVKRIVGAYDLMALRERARFGGQLTYHISWILARCLNVLGRLHNAGVVHGMIAPPNIMVNPNNHDGFVINFEMAVLDAHQAEATFRGLNNSSAPEVRDGNQPDPAADMYSLGLAMLYLSGGNLEDLSFPPSLEPWLQEFLAQLLARSPWERLRDAWGAWRLLRLLREEAYGDPIPFESLIIEEEARNG